MERTGRWDWREAGGGVLYRNVARVHYRVLYKRIALSTLAARIRCQPFLEAGADVQIDRGLRIRPYDGNGGGLRILLEGHNYIGRYNTFQGRGPIEFGEHSRARSFCLFDASERISIGAYTGIADFVSIRDTDHRFDRLDVPIRHQRTATAPVVIGDDVWVGHGATILRGVTIGNGAVVAAAAVVTRDVPERAIVGGVPAKVIGMREEAAAQPDGARGPLTGRRAHR